MMNKGVHLEEAFAGVQIPSDKQQQILDIMKKGSAEQPEVLDSGSHRLSHGAIELAHRRNDSGNSPHDEQPGQYYTGSDGKSYPLLANEGEGYGMRNNNHV